MIFFAPGACRFNAANQPIPGGNIQTQGWSIAQYKAFVRQNQGADIQIVETPFEQDTLIKLKAALAKVK